MAINIGDVSEGAFALSLGLFVIDNDEIKDNTNHLQHSSSNIKWWMQQIQPQLFINGGGWSTQLYNGYATLASRVGKTPVMENKTVRGGNTIPYDIAEVNVFINLKAAAVADAFGKPFEDTTLNSIIQQMVTASARYKDQINSYKNRFMTNNRAEYFRINISTIGIEGEQSGGAIKGDIQMTMSIQAVDINSRRPIGLEHKRKFPMYFSLKASRTVPKTISNESPITSLSALSQAFGVDVLGSETENPLISKLPLTTEFTTTADRKSQQWEIDLFGSNSLVLTGQTATRISDRQTVRYMNVGNTTYEVGSYRIYDLIDPNKFPALRTARSASDKVWKSMVIDRYVRSVFNLLPSGSLNNQDALYVWNFLIQSAFGMGNYAKETFLAAFGANEYQGSSLDYIQAVQNATKDSNGNQMIYCEKNPTQVSFYVGDQARSTAKLFHIRYKNRTSYQGDIGTNARFNLNDVVKLELKIMPEVGQAFKEISGWSPGQQLSFSNSTLQIAQVAQVA